VQVVVACRIDADAATNQFQPSGHRSPAVASFVVF
jgi:hypothetical protein